MKKIFRLLNNLLFDFRYGGFLGGVKKTQYAELGAMDTANSDYNVLQLLFPPVVHIDYILVDVGCGKGRVLNYLLRNYKDNRIVGIELDPGVAAVTARRLRKFKNVSIVNKSALEFMPSGKLLIYMFNPFSCSVMKLFAERLLSLVESGHIDQNFRIIYYNAVCVDVFKNMKFVYKKLELPNLYHDAYMIYLDKSI